MSVQILTCYSHTLPLDGRSWRQSLHRPASAASLDTDHLFFLFFRRSLAEHCPTLLANLCIAFEEVWIVWRQPWNCCDCKCTLVATHRPLVFMCCETGAQRRPDLTDSTNSLFSLIFFSIVMNFVYFIFWSAIVVLFKPFCEYSWTLNHNVKSKSVISENWSQHDFSWWQLFSA